MIVKPIPFRPTASHYASTTFLQPNEYHFEPRSSSKVVRRAMSMSRLATSSSQDDGYFSHGVLSEDSCTNSRNSTIIASSEHHLNRKQSLSEFDLKNENNLENIAEHDCCESYSDRIYTPFCQSRSSGQSGYTPSPSDSGIGELEALIRERNVELRQLRKTMELNENAMMMVFREKQKEHENDLAKMNHDWSLKLEAQEQTSFQTEQKPLASNSETSEREPIVARGTRPGDGWTESDETGQLQVAETIVRQPEQSHGAVERAR